MEKRLPKKITSEIRDILEKCQSGKLKHSQADYHCGTSHCISGWKAVRDYAKHLKDRSILSQPMYDGELSEEFISFIEKEETKTLWGYAQTVWKLTNNEAMMLFQGGAVFSEQFALLEKLERGERVE